MSENDEMVSLYTHAKNKEDEVKIITELYMVSQYTVRSLLWDRCVYEFTTDLMECVLNFMEEHEGDIKAVKKEFSEFYGLQQIQIDRMIKDYRMYRHYNNNSFDMDGCKTAQKDTAKRCEQYRAEKKKYAETFITMLDEYIDTLNGEMEVLKGNLKEAQKERKRWEHYYE